MATAIANNREDIDANTLDIQSLSTTVGNHTTQIGNLQTLTNRFGVSIANNLASVVLNGTVNNLTNKTYVDNKVSTGDTATLNSAKAYADSLIGTSLSFRTGTIRWSNTSSAQTFKTCHCMFIGTNDKRNGLFIPTEFIDADYNKTILFRVYNGTYFACRTDTSDVGWFAAYSVTFTED